MSHWLVSFLELSQIDPKTGYRRTRYRFSDWSIYEEPYFGFALTKYIQPDGVVVLGTSGSMWDVFTEDLAQGMP